MVPRTERVQVQHVLEVEFGLQNSPKLRRSPRLHTDSDWDVLALFFLLFFLFFRRALNILFGTMTTLTIRLLHTAPSNSDLTTLVITADAEISWKIVECSDRILLQGQIRWKEDNFKVSDYI